MSKGKLRGMKMSDEERAHFRSLCHIIKNVFGEEHPEHKEACALSQLGGRHDMLRNWNDKEALSNEIIEYWWYDEASDKDEICEAIRDSLWSIKNDPRRTNPMPLIFAGCLYELFSEDGDEFQTYVDENGNYIPSSEQVGWYIERGEAHISSQDDELFITGYSDVDLLLPHIYFGGE